MHINQQAAILIRSLMRDLHASEHIVFRGPGGHITSKAVLAELDKSVPADNSASDAVAEEEFQMKMHGYRGQD